MITLQVISDTSIKSQSGGLNSQAAHAPAAHAADVVPLQGDSASVLSCKVLTKHLQSAANLTHC